MKDEAIFFLVVGTGMAAGGAYYMWRGVKSRAWPAVWGEITASKVEETFEDDSTKYSVQVGYRYSVKGQDFESDRIAFGAVPKYSEASAQEAADQYPVGKRVKVHVCPTDPSDAVLEAEVTWGSIILTVAGVLAILFGLYEARH